MSSVYYYIRIHNIVIIKFNFVTQNFYIIGIWRTTVRTSDDVILFLKSNRICVFSESVLSLGDGGRGRRKVLNKKQWLRMPRKCTFPIPRRRCQRSDLKYLNTDNGIPCLRYTGVNSDFEIFSFGRVVEWLVGGAGGIGGMTRKQGRKV